MSASNYLENALLDAVTNNASFTSPATIYMKLHTGDPGEAGTSNASAETTRKVVTYGAASSGVATQNGTDPTWTSWPGGANGEVITYFSIWDHLTAGNCLFAGSFAAGRTMNTGDTFISDSTTITAD